MTSKEGLFARLAKTRQHLASGLFGVFGVAREIDESIYEEMEDQMLMADMGVQTSQHLLSALRRKAHRQRYRTTDELLTGLRETVVEVLAGPEHRGDQDSTARPRVTLMVGVNGVGKTTSLAKMAHRYKNHGNRVMLAACDTFRAAAIEQLQSWGDRLELPVITQPHGSDAAAVAYDAYQAACSRQTDHLLIDTAGRQHTHGDLMEQLKKIKRVLGKVDSALPHEVLLTVDAGNGQNVLSQVENFHQAIPLTGLCVTKLDGTAKGGVVIAVAERYGIPIRYIGVGEGLEDLREFVPVDFVNALIPERDGSR